jgi:hypothetical protein
MFAPCRAELEAYGIWLRDGSLTVRADHLLQEVRLRLRHLQRMFERCMELDASLERAARSATPPDQAQPGVMKLLFCEQSIADSDPQQQASLTFQPQDELWVLLESFYYSAHRVRDIFQDNKTDLPGMHKFEAVGVRTARNHLIEHTDGAGGVLVPSIACGGPVGPQLRLIRWSLDSTGSHDPGLRANATEFTNNLLLALRRARSAA